MYLLHIFVCTDYILQNTVCNYLETIKMVCFAQYLMCDEAVLLNVMCKSDVRQIFTEGPH